MNRAALVPELPSATDTLETEIVGGVTTGVTVPALVIAFCHFAVVVGSSAMMLPMLNCLSPTPVRV